MGTLAEHQPKPAIDDEMWFLLWKRLYRVTVTIFTEYLIVTVTIFKKYLIVTIFLGGGLFYMVLTL